MSTRANITILAVLILGMGLLFYRQHRLQADWAREKAALQESVAAAESRQADLTAVQNATVVQAKSLTDALAEATNELATARLKVEAFEAKRALEKEAQAAELKKASDSNQLKAQVPAPLVQTTPAPAGKELKSVVFPKLVGTGGQTLAVDAEFRTQVGRRFVFRSGNGRPLAYDLDELHPGVILHLGQTRETVLSAQAEVDRQARLAEQNYRAQLVARAEAEKKAAAQRAKLAVEYAKIAEERRKAQVEEQLQLQAAETERLKAAASLRAADAAVQEALRPFYPDYIIEQIITPVPVPVPVPVPQSPAQPSNPFVRDPRIN